MQKNRQRPEVFNVANVMIITTIVVIMIITVLSLMGCPKPTTLTDKQRATVMLNIYNAEYEDTMAVMSSPTSTPAQKAVGAKKKAILTQIWPLLKIYVAVVDGGGTPEPDTIKQLTDLINQLTTIATGGST